MKFYTDKKESSSVKIFLEDDGKGSVKVMGEDYAGRSWIIITFLPSGRFTKHPNLGQYLGITTDNRGCILESIP